MGRRRRRRARAVRGGEQRAVQRVDRRVASAGSAGVRLRAGLRDPKIAALDLTFSAPKSVSVLFAVAPAEVSAELVAAHEEAVRAAVGYLEDTAVMVRRGHAGEVHEPGGGFIAAAYRHRMSRALDPQLHTHVVAAQPHARPGRALHRARRRRRCTGRRRPRATSTRRICGPSVRERLGLEWGPVHKGAAELREVPAGVLRTFSQRRAQVRAAVAVKEAELGRPSTKAERATWGAIATRDRKQYGDRDAHLAGRDHRPCRRARPRPAAHRPDHRPRARSSSSAANSPRDGRARAGRCAAWGRGELAGVLDRSGGSDGAGEHVR